MYYGIRRAVELVERDPDLAALIITGTEDVFAAGGDFRGDPDEVLPEGVSNQTALPFTALRNARVPVVAAVNGICHGGGLLIALLCDVIVASERATFRSPEVRRGHAELWLAQVVPAHVGVARARDLCMTSRKLTAQEAVEWGLISRMAAHDELAAEAERAAYELLEAAPMARNRWKSACNAQYGVIDEIGFALNHDLPEWSEGTKAFLEKRPPSWSHGSSQQYGR